MSDHIPIGAGPDDVEAAIVADGEIKTPEASAAGAESQALTISTGNADGASGEIVISTGDSNQDDSGNIWLYTGEADGAKGAVSIQKSSGSIAFFGVNPVGQQGLGTITAAAIAQALFNLGLCFDDS